MRLIAHRGRKIGDPENSLASLAGLPEGIDGIEVDVRLSADGVPVMIHDVALTRVTENGLGRVDETSYSQLQTLRLMGSDEPPPDMETYLHHAAARLWSSHLRPGAVGAASLYLDIKPGTTQAVARIASIVANLPFKRGIVCLVKESAALETLSRTGGGQLRLGLLRCNGSNLDEKLAAARRHHAEVLFVQHGLMAFCRNQHIVSKIRGADFEVGGSTLNGQEALRTARDAGCHLVLTDICCADSVEQVV